MRIRHFEAIGPICPSCRAERNEEHRVAISVVVRQDGDDLIEGLLQCSAPECLREFPVIDGIPLLVPDVSGYLSTQLGSIVARDDLGAITESLLGEGAGPGSWLDIARSQLSSYAWDHYGQWDPAGVESEAAPGSAARVLAAGLALAEQGGLRLSDGPLLDLGCAAGRATFELAGRTNNLVVGMDLGFHLLRHAARVLRTGSARYPLRRGGLRYDRREFAVPLGGRERIDFWGGDAVRLPFAASTFAGTTALNLLDCLYSPLDLLRELARVVAPGGLVMIATPYDWTPSATPVEAWIGGHSPRSFAGGESAPVLRALLTPGAHAASVAGLELIADADDVPWTVRIHDRSVVHYRVHLAVAVRR